MKLKLFCRHNRVRATIMGDVKIHWVVKVMVTALLCVPAVVIRFSGIELGDIAELAIFAIAIVSAAFLLTWAAEAAQKDVSGALALAVLALIAVLPEYVVDIYYAFRSGSDPSYAQFAAANMTGSNRLLMGFGWPVVALISIWMVSKLRQPETTNVPTTALKNSRIKGLRLATEHRADIGYLMILALLAIPIPLLSEIPVWYGMMLIAVFVMYLWQATRQEADEEPDLVGLPAKIAELNKNTRRTLLIAMLVGAATVILFVAEPFANTLVDAGSALGVDSFFLVQWVAPLASEAPEFIIAILFALQGKGTFALMMLISAKVNQWSLLVGSLPLAHMAGGGPAAIPLDARQVGEFVLTTTQTLLGVSILIALVFHRNAAIMLAGLFALQFVVTDINGRYILSAIQLAIALAFFIRNRRDVLPVLTAPFRALQTDRMDKTDKTDKRNRTTDKDDSGMSGDLNQANAKVREHRLG